MNKTIQNLGHDLPAKFGRMKTRLVTRPMVPFYPGEPLEVMRPYSFDIGRDRRGQFFDLELNPLRVRSLIALDVRPKRRHLLLLLREHGEANGRTARTDHRILCGFDERELFLAVLPADRRISTVVQAMEALKPNIVRNSQRRHRVKTQDRNRRRNAGFVRQGEWFFVPDPTFHPNGRVCHRNEPLIRGAGKPHIAECLVRVGGRTAYAQRWGGRVITDAQYRQLLRDNPRTKPGEWLVVTQEPVVHARGKVSHPDHRTVQLVGWHRVEVNTEQNSGRGTNLVYVD